MTIDQLRADLLVEDMNTEYKGIILEGEDQKGGRREHSWLKTLVAFANTEGGRMLVGVEDKTHTIVALDQETVDKTVLMVHRLVGQRIKPSLPYKLHSIPVPGTKPTRFLLEIDVAKSPVLPVYEKVGNDGMIAVFVRNYGRTDIATPEEIRDLVLLSDGTPYDQGFTQAPFKADQFTKLFSCVKERTSSSLTKNALIAKGFMNRDGFLSKGALLFKDDCNDRRTLVSATLWPSSTKGSSIVLASGTFAGNLLDAITFSVSFIENHSANGFRKTDTGRVDYVAYPKRSVVEGVVNAIAHRNYFMTGSQIEINLFKDRLEITSPGSLLGVQRLEKETHIASIIPRRRNEVICSILELCHYMEGFDKIAQDYAPEDEKHQPFISTNESSFTLTLPNLTFTGTAPHIQEATPVYTVDSLEGEHDQQILSYCWRHGRTAKDIASYLHVTPSTYFRTNILSRLVKDGYLLETKQGRSSYFRANGEKVFEE